VTLNLNKRNWPRVVLGDVARHVTDRVDPETSGLTRFLAGEHIGSQDLQVRTWGVIGEGPIGPMFYKRFKPGHVLYVSRRSYLRKTAVPEFEGICSEKTFVLETKSDTQFLQRFLPFVLSAERFHEYAIRMSRGSVNPYLNWTDLAAYEFDLPSIDEQNRLADLLWAIERHRLAISNAALGTAESRILESLLRRDSGQLARIDSLGSVLIGRQRSPKYANGEHMVSYLRVANVGDNKLRLGDVKKMNFTPEEQEHYRVLPNDILISEGQSRELVGQSALVTSLPESVCFQNTLIRFRPNVDIIHPAYAQALFRACLYSGVFVEIATQTTSIAHLGVQRFARLNVPVPSMDEQESYLARFDPLRDAIESINSESSSLSSLYQALLYEIFDGAG
jgi:type I restriction enzyme S subunit